MTTKRLSYICPIGNGLLTFGVLCVFALCAGKTAYELVTSYFWALAIAMIVASVVTWRTYADMKRLLAGKRGWRRPLFEGFCFGFLPGPMTHGLGMIKEAFASGPPWPSFGHSSLLDWLTYFSLFIPWWALFGAVGAAYAVVLSGMNRIALKVFADNQAMNATPK